MNVPNILQYSTEFEAASRWMGGKFTPFVRGTKRCPETHSCTIKATTDTQFGSWAPCEEEADLSKCLPEGPWAQPALALLIHSVFVKQTFNFTSICQMSTASMRHLPELCRFFLFFDTKISGNCVWQEPLSPNQLQE